MPSAGTEVQLHGLRSKLELNGQRGRVEAYDAASQRYVVRLGGVDEPIAVHPKNLGQLSTATASQPEKSRSAEQRLVELNRLLELGLVTPAEKLAKKMQILRDV